MSEVRDANKRTKTRKKKWTFKRILILILVILLLGGIGVYAWSHLRAQYTVTYDAYSARKGTISNSLSFSGTVELRNSRMYTAPSAATVKIIYVQEGDPVRKGDRLIRLSSGSTLTADLDGKVNVVSVQKGDEVDAGANLLQIADFAHPSVAFRIDEYDISDVAVGDACTVTATATEKVFRSSVESINYISSSSGNVAYYTSRANLELEDDSGIYPGMQVTVTIPQEEAVDVVVLKQEALSFSRENRAFVYKMDEDGKMTETPVEVGVSNGNYVEIQSGVQDGETVYAVTKAQTADPLASMFSGMFGQQRVNRNNQTRNNRNNNNNNNSPGNGTSNSPGNGTNNRQNNAPPAGGSGGGR